MRIAFIDDEPEIWPRQYGGKARSITGLACELANCSAVSQVSILSQSIGGDAATFENRGVTYQRLCGYSIPGQISRVLAKSDVVSVHTCSYTFPRRTDTECRVVYNLHDVLLAAGDRGAHLDKALAGPWSCVLAPSVFAARTYYNAGGRDPVSIVNRGIEAIFGAHIERDDALCCLREAIGPKAANLIANSYPLLLFPNRTGCGKGERFLPGLISALKGQYPSPLAIVTDESVADHEGTLGIGWVEPRLLCCLYALADVTLILSTLPEAFCRAAAESLAAATPVVALGFGNLASMAAERESITVAEPEVGSIAAAVRAALATRSEALARDAGIIAKEHSYPAVARAHLNAYAAALAWRNAGETRRAGTERRHFRSPLATLGRNDAWLGSQRGSPAVRLRIDRNDAWLLRKLEEARSEDELAASFKGEREELVRALARLVASGLVETGYSG